MSRYPTVLKAGDRVHNQRGHALKAELIGATADLSWEGKKPGPRACGKQPAACGREKTLALLDGSVQ